MGQESVKEMAVVDGKLQNDVLENHLFVRYLICNLISVGRRRENYLRNKFDSGDDGPRMFTAENIL